ncbi:MAG: hypothetical protein H6661_05845 [Ardenticatenaceae bacterium]|nr:hypothetical protein [Ardenticatenaceae bacterium]
MVFHGTTQLLNAHYNNDLVETHVVNIKICRAIPEWPADWVLEMPALVQKAGLRRCPHGRYPRSVRACGADQIV